MDSATRAILVTSATVGQLDPAWLRAQYDAGVVIAGVNVPSRDLRALVGDTSPGRAPDSDPDAPFVSTAHVVTCSSGAPNVSNSSFGLVGRPPRSHPENAIPILILNLESDISAGERACR